MTRYASAVLALFALLGAGCETRALPTRDPVFEDVRPVLERACAPCHTGDGAEAGWRTDSYLEVIACPSGGGPAVAPPDETAAILSVLEREDHADLLSEQERALLREWVETGAALRRGAAHAGGWADPRSADFHGAALADESWVRMLDDEAEGACATCHGAPRPDAGLDADGGVSGRGSSAPGATPCGSCHTDEGGPLACSTCHGQLGQPYPPRDPCFHADEAGGGGAHAAHVEAGLLCTTCHGARTVEELGVSEHGDGVVQVALDPAVAGADARWDPGSETCSGTCHDRGGDGPMSPGWRDDLALGCGSCHTSPPDEHYAGSCDSCHAEASADGTRLSGGPLHANGSVDLGDGGGGCGACHGGGDGADDPWPMSGAHAAHRSPQLSEALDCSECHTVPEAVADPGHLDSTVGPEVVFGALASARGSDPRREPDGTCAEVACHGAGLGGGAAQSPSWVGDSAYGSCGACHGLPPPPPHLAPTSCSSLLCHGGYVAPGPNLTEAGRAVHVNGVVDLWGTP